MGHPYGFQMATTVPSVTYKEDNDKGKNWHPFLCTFLEVKKVEGPPMISEHVICLLLILFYFWLMKNNYVLIQMELSYQEKKNSFGVGVEEEQN